MTTPARLTVPRPGQHEAPVSTAGVPTGLLPAIGGQAVANKLIYTPVETGLSPERAQARADYKLLTGFVDLLPMASDVVYPVGSGSSEKHGVETTTFRHQADKKMEALARTAVWARFNVEPRPSQEFTRGHRNMPAWLLAAKRNKIKDDSLIPVLLGVAARDMSPTHKRGKSANQVILGGSNGTMPPEIFIANVTPETLKLIEKGRVGQGQADPEAGRVTLNIASTAEEPALRDCRRLTEKALIDNPLSGFDFTSYFKSLARTPAMADGIRNLARDYWQDFTAKPAA